MRKCFFTICFIATVFVSTAQSRSFAGKWLGSLDVGMPLRIVLNITATSDGYSATMDSPDQGVTGIATSGVRVVADSIYVDVAAIKGSYKGLRINDSTITGSWSQGPASLALTLKTVSEVKMVERPQTPKGTANYNVEEIEFDASPTVHLAGTFTYPSTGGPFATAVLITGSGQQDRDETLAGHKPFAIIADHLTKKGLAVLRLDDRGAGKSTGEVATATSSDFAKDIEAALQFIGNHKAVDKSKLGLIGHSEGGLIASIVGSRNPNLNFIILLAGPGTKGATLLADQGVAILTSSGLSPAAANAYRPFYLQMINATVSAKDSASAYESALAYYKKWAKATPSAYREQLGISSDPVAAEMIRGLVSGFSQPWMKYFIQTDPTPYLQKVSAKVLALNGEKDLQVLPKQNLAGIKAALQKSKSKTYQVKELKGLNHLFQACKTCTIQEYAQLEESFSPVALAEISNWLSANVLKK